MKIPSILLIAGLLFLPAFAHSQTTEVPQHISYQGFVTDVTGTSLGNTAPQNHEMIFRIWDNPTANASSNLIYAEKQVVTISNGEFSVLIGAGADVPGEETKGPTTINLSEAFSGSQRYLGVTVAAAAAPDVIDSSDVEITPRQQLVSTAFSFRAKVAESVENSAITSNMLAESVVTGNKIANGSIATIDLANSAVTTATIADGTIGNADLAANSVTSSNIVDGTIVTADLANNSVNASKLAGDVGLWSVNGNDVFRSAGNVGIGTTPNSKLHVDGTLRVEDQLYLGEGSRIWYKDSANTDQLLILPDSGPGDHWTYIKYAPAGLNLQSISGVSRFAVRDNGNVGIGGTNAAATAALGGKLNIHGDPGTVIRVSDGWGVMKIDGNSIAAYQPDGTTASTLYLSDNGGHTRVGGTVTFTGNSYNQGDTFLHGQAVIYGHISSDAMLNIGMKNGVSWAVDSTGPMRAAYFTSLSDLRIKDIVGRSSGKDDLAVLQQIEVTDFRYKDRWQHGDSITKKVIAQQVDTVYPEAVDKSTGVIPDILEQAEAIGAWVQLETDLEVGDRVRLVGENKEGVYEVLELGDGAFRTEFEPEAGQVFVFGREVSDFHSVDYEALSMLNVSATQELARKLEVENQELRQRVAVLTAEAQQRDARLAAIEKLLTANLPESLQQADAAE
ncbi:MAG: hypothetical protein ACSHYA_13220 [Opitutaceae bacterium]